MKAAMTENPFPVTTYLGPEYFCDREEETTRLLNNILNGNSTTLISLRRIGKTGLIHHVLAKLPKGWKGIYIDILETENLNQFLNKLTTSIITAVPEKSLIGKRFLDILKSLRPVIYYDPLTGVPQASFDIKPKEAEMNIDSILAFLDSQEEKFVVAIDEFQQISKYPEQNTDAWLRTRIQQMKNVVFIFSGSQQHLMAELFTSPQRPFFRSTQILKLSKINKEVYSQHITKLFNAFGRNINSAIADEILDWTNIHTFYVQQLCNRVFSTNEKNVTSDLWKMTAFQLLNEQETIFYTLRGMLTKSQWSLLKAIAYEEKVYQPTAKQFLTTYHLGTSATVLRSMKTLLEYELIYKEFDQNGNHYYSVYDVFIQRWIDSSK